MINLSEWALKHRSLVAYIMIVAVIAGVLSYFRLGRSEDPTFIIKTMVVQAAWPGATVEENDIAGYLHFVEDIDRAPIEMRYRRPGVLWMASGPGRVQRGDVVAVVMNDYDDAIAAA